MRGRTWSTLSIALAVLAAVLFARGRSSREGRADPAGRTDGEQGAFSTNASSNAPSFGESGAADSAFADTLIRAVEATDGEVRVRVSDLPPPERDPARINHLLATRSTGTYLGEMLAARDSMNYRWPERPTDPLRVWIQEVGDPSGVSRDASSGVPREVSRDASARVAIVRGAFGAWEETGLPLRFSFTPDSTRADIHVTWVDRFESLTSGMTSWAHDQHGWIIGGSVRLAEHQPDGRPLDAASLAAIARHEVGHLIGLDHTSDERHIMSARVRVVELSEADRATVRLVYALPPGSLKSR